MALHDSNKPPIRQWKQERDLTCMDWQPLTSMAMDGRM
jgi:hypothetical protein